MTSLDKHGIVVRCPQCNTRNRLAYGTLDRATRCGRCGTDLPAPSAPIPVDAAEDFDALIAGSPLPVLVDYWAAWCGPCRTVAPEVAAAARALQGHGIVVKIDTEALPELAERARVQSIPLLVVFAGGREADRLVGARPAAEIAALVRGVARG